MSFSGTSVNAIFEGLGSFAVRLEKLLKVVRGIRNQQPFYVTDEDGEETDDLLNCENEKLPKEMMVAFE